MSKETKNPNDQDTLTKEKLDSGRAIWLALRSKIEAQEEVSSHFPRVNMLDLAKAANGLGAWLSKESQAILAKVNDKTIAPETAEAIKLLEGGGLALSYIETERQAAAADQKNSIRDEHADLIRETDELHKLSMHWLSSLQAANLISAKKAAYYRAGFGYLNNATDLQGLGPIYEKNYLKLAGLQTDVEDSELKLTHQKAKRMSVAGSQLFDLVSGAGEEKEAPDIDWRAQVVGLYYLLEGAFRKARAASLLHLLWEGRDDEANEKLPPTFIGLVRKGQPHARGRRGEKATDLEPEPEETKTDEEKKPDETDE